MKKGIFGTIMILEDVINFLKRNPPFQFLDDTTLKGMAGSLSMQFYPMDTVILKQDDPPGEAVWIIKKGGVRITMRSEDGEDTVVDYRGIGDTFGFLSMFGKERQKTTVTTIDDTICYILGRDKVLKLIEISPPFAEYFMSYLSRYVDKVYREMHTKSLFYGSADRLLFTTKVGDIAKEVASVSEDTAIQEAAQIMAKNKISSVVVLDKSNLPAGIITDKDIRERVVAKGRITSEPVRNIMTSSLVTADANDSCFDAVLKMIKYNIHHILSIKNGELQGIMTNHDLMLLQGTSPLSLARNVDNQQTIDGLVFASNRINKLVGLLLKEGAKASSILTIVTEINDRLVSKVIQIAEGELGQPRIPYCWIAFGSEGRREQIFKTDQDNAIIYADPETAEEEEEARRYFSAFTCLVTDSLMKIGYPLCSSGYMASNPQWCQPLNAWREYFNNWLNNPTPEVISRAITFLDFRPLYGKFSLAEDLRDSIISMLSGGSSPFLSAMADFITKNTPPVGFFRSFVVEKSGEHKDEFDLKMKGTIPMVDAVRFLAIEKGIRETSTLGRMIALKGKDAVITEKAEEFEQSYEFMMLLRIQHQIEQIIAGKKPDNFIKPGNLSALEKKTIKEAFNLILKLQAVIGEKYQFRH